MDKNIKELFDPKGVVVIGVSADPKKLGSVILNNIIRFGYEGKLASVNPKYESLYDLNCYKSVVKVPFEIDLAVIVIPSQFVYDSIVDCAKKKVKNVVIITAGFQEMGSDGKELEQKIHDYAIEHGINIVGPNCLGLISNPANLNASFAAQNPRDGNIAFLSQSGAFNAALLDLTENKLLGFKYFISLGNKSDINENDLFEAWLKDPEIKVLGAYLEEFEDGKKFVEIINKNPHKPIVLLNSGITEEGRRAASSHTGSLAGSARSVKTALKQVGVIQVDSIEKMYSNLMLFSWAKLPKGKKVALVTNAGGPGIIITDILSDVGLEIAQLSDETKDSLQKILPKTASINNPVDLLGDALADRYREALKIISTDPNVDVIMVLLTPQLVTQIEETAKVIIDFYQGSEFPIIPVFIGEKYVEPGLERMWSNQIPAFQYDEEAVAALKNLIHYSTAISKRKYSKPPNLRSSKLSGDVKIQVDKAATAIPPHLSKQITDEAGIDTPREFIGNSYEEILKYFDKGEFPVVLKATTEDVPHKTEQKLIFLNIYSEQDLLVAFEQLQTTLRAITKKAKPNILIQEMIYAKEELIMGINYDQDFGHILLFGKGGIYTEVFKDTSTRLVYSSHDQLSQMIDETSVSQILNGARGLEKLPTDKILTTLDNLQRIVLRYPEIRSIDINPAMVTVNRCIAVDVKMFI